MTRVFRALVHRMLHALAIARRLPLALTGAHIGPGVRVGPGCEIALGAAPSRRGEIVLRDGVRIDRGVLLHPYGGCIDVGAHVYIGPYTTIYGHGGITIGRDTLISMHCRILSSNHEISRPGVAIRSRPDVPLATRIGEDVWLGAGVTVLGGVTVGDGCIVGAGAVVTRDLPSNSIAYGVPARITGQRGAA